MPFEYLTNVPLEQAVKEYVSDFIKQRPCLRDERMPVVSAHGRITSHAVYANISAPHYNACAMDGIALKASVTFGATETTPVSLSKGMYVRVDTGDPLPLNCDTVVMIEDVVENGDDVMLYSAAVPWQHVRQIGEDICAGDMIIPSFTYITPYAAGALLAGGVLNIDVIKTPLVGIIPTGDEVVEPSEMPLEGHVIEFNSTIFSGMLSAWGASAKVYPIVKDNHADIVSALRTALEECDAVILNAGSSAGSEDFSSAAISSIGRILHHGIAIKPGKPAILGFSGDKPILGVPGYPVSGIIVLEQIMKPIINILTGNRDPELPEYEKAVVSRRMASSLKYHEFVRARLGEVENKLVAVPLSRGAGVISSFVKADCLIEIPQNAEGIEAGEEVNVRLLRRRSELKRMVMVTGSHDPLIDEIADIVRRSTGDIIGSSHVGSMGGIMAVKRKEAHLGGIHLLSEDDGTYNIPYMRQFFLPDEALLVRGVKRTQGLIVSKGNTKGINSITDLARSEISFVNRQKGSGTRILLDFLLGQKGIDTKSLYGYEREEFTHTAVAAQIAAGTADAGMGIYSASKLYDLDFIPICEEDYDFIVLRSAFGLPAVQKFIEVLKSDEFASRLANMGGYVLKMPGEVIEWN